MKKRNASQNSVFLLPVLLGMLAAPAYSHASMDAGSAEVSELSTDRAAAKTSEPEKSELITAVAGNPQATAPTVGLVPVAERTSLDRLSSEVLNILIPSFVSMVGLLAAMLLAWLGKKVKIDINEKRMQQWQGIAKLAAGRAGEWARNEAKTLTEGETIPGPDILEVGVNWGIEYGVAHGLPNIGRRKLEGLLESYLHFERNTPET